MADNKKFGSPRGPRFGDTTSPGGDRSSDGAHCARCEAMLADALDGTLSPADQAIFDLHMGHCGPCSQMLADAQRGAAWLEMLRDPRPQPPAELLERILAQTSGSQVLTPHAEAQLHGSMLTPAPSYGIPAHAAQFGQVIPFRSRFASAARVSALGQIMLQPRLAMTAAMAFLSIALTLDLTGVRLQDIRLSDLQPGSLVRDLSSANAHIVQYYEGLRVVYELESRVHDFENVSDEAPAGTQTNPAPDSSPASSPGSSPNNAAPDDSAPNDSQPAQPNPANRPSSVQPQPRQRRPAPNSGTSRREGLKQNRSIAELELFSRHAAAERRAA